MGPARPRNRIVRGYALATVGLVLAISGMAPPWFAHVGFDPGYTGPRSFSAFETSIGLPILVVASIGWLAVFASRLAAPNLRAPLARAGMIVLVVLAVLLLIALFSAPLDAGGLSVGAFVAALGFLLSAYGARSLARAFPTTIAAGV